MILLSLVSYDDKSANAMLFGLKRGRYSCQAAMASLLMLLFYPSLSRFVQRHIMHLLVLHLPFSKPPLLFQVGASGESS